MLLGVVIQWFVFPNTLFEDIGPLKAQFTTKSKDMDAIIKFGGGLLLTLAMALSGVSWNPINGKMAGLGGLFTAGYTTYCTFKSDGDVFKPQLFYIYSAIILLGSLHIFAFPSNPLPEKTPETKNNHGNFSDVVAFALIGCSMMCFFYPAHLFQDFGPVKAQFTTKSRELSAMIKFVACLMLVLALLFSGVKWNPINGKMAGLGGFIAAGYTAYCTYKAHSEVFVPCAFYIYSGVIFLGALHIFFFPSNPLIKKPAAKKD